MKRIVLNLRECQDCQSCTVDCGYFYRPPGSDGGLLSLKERATFLVVCRRCEHASCIAACPFEALERQEDGVVHRYNLRCVSCKLCTQACPFGTIYPDMVGFYASPCDYCLDDDDQPPPCVSGCVRDAVSYREVDPAEPNLHLIDDHLAVIGDKWEKENVEAREGGPA